MSGITVEGLGKKIKGTVILHDVNMTLEPGRIYGLRGRNGCGKTMIMRSLCGLLIPDKGTVTIDGEVLHRDIKFPRSVGVLIENPSFLPQYTGYRNLRMLARLTGGISDSDIRTALMRTGLDPDDSRTYRKYSLGMKQKLGIANAIMGEPDVIILDEPINALDEQTVENIKTELLKLRDAGKVIVIACHDRDELEYSLEKLSEYAPVLQSVSIVPVGLSRYRKGLYPLESFDKEDARYLISQVERWQKIMVKKHGIHFVHASDEWYILAGYELPEEGRYDGYLQLENGVGMMRLLETEVKERLEQLEGDDREVNATVATGRLAAPYIGKMIKLVQKKFPNVQAEVYAVKNNFFGEKITVSGLITATDLMDQLAQRDLGEKVLIPCNMLRSGEDVFLDDLTVEDVRQALKTEVVVVDEPGADLVNCLIEAPDHKKIRRRQIYEQTGSSDSGQA